MDHQPIIAKAMEYGSRCHRECNHLYDGHPYDAHLMNVAFWVRIYSEGLSGEEKLNLVAAAFAHDVIEDCRQTYSDVKRELGETIAELVYAVTNEKGRNRHERESDKYFADMKLVPHATLLKICDRIANFDYSIRTGSSKARMYYNDMARFLDLCDAGDYYPDAVDHLINLSIRYEINRQNKE